MKRDYKSAYMALRKNPKLRKGFDKTTITLHDKPEHKKAEQETEKNTTNNRIPAAFAYLIIFAAIPIIYIFSLGNIEPAVPQIRYGEFPYTLTYELYGEIKESKGKIICQYDGNTTSGMLRRKWSSQIFSISSLDNKIQKTEHLIFLDLRSQIVMDDNGNQILYLYFDYGDPEYYMGDKANTNVGAEPQSLDHVLCSYKPFSASSYANTDYYSCTAEYAYEKFGVKLINWECAPPIKNEFK